MRRPRAKVDGDAYYHVTSRCALQTYLLKDDGEEVKSMFMKMLRRAEYFSGVEIVNYCIMDNHFHILLFVPKRREVNDEELIARISVLYGPEKTKRILNRWKQLRADGDVAIIEKECAAFRKRMYDISEFMKTFKQRFSLWFCSNHNDLEGTIWQGAFHSVLVEGKHDALGAISTYITLNPVRAKMVANASDYIWSGYGAACAGDIEAKKALLATYTGKASMAQKWEAYKAMIAVAVAESGIEKTGSSKSAEMAKSDAPGTEKANVSEPEFKRGLDATKIREKTVSRGLAFGSKAFVEAAIAETHNTVAGLSRTKPTAYCLGEQKTPLYYASRHTA